MMRLRATVLLIFFVLLVPAHCRTSLADTPQTLTLPSALPSGIPNVDRISVRYFSAVNPTAAPSPAVVIVPPLGSLETDPLMSQLARYLAGRGIAAAVMALPYHGQRALPHEFPISRFAGGDVAQAVQAYSQGASDVSTVAARLRARPDVDPARVGVIGISLGAIVTHLAMGEDERLTVGVAALGGGDLPDLYRRGLLSFAWGILHRRRLGEEALAGLRPVDPLTYAGRSHPRHVLMIQGARDPIVPPHDATALWEALGRPPIQWIDAGHLALSLAPRSAFRAASDYLVSVWEGHPATEGELPRVWAPTLKAGLIVADHLGVVPALQWQALALGRRHHMALVGGNIGINTHGPFAAVAVTVTPFLDAGLLVRSGGGRVRPYAGLHFVF